MRKLGLALACLAFGLGLYFACASGEAPPAPTVTKQVPDVAGRYVVTLGRGEAAHTLTLDASAEAGGGLELEFPELGVTSRATLESDGTCRARFVIPEDPELETPREVWLLSGRFVFTEDSPYLDGDFRVEVDGQRNAVFRRISSYYAGPLEE